MPETSLKNYKQCRCENMNLRLPKFYSLKYWSENLCLPRFDRTTCWRRPSVTGSNSKSESAPDLRDQRSVLYFIMWPSFMSFVDNTACTIHPLHTALEYAQWALHIHCNYYTAKLQCSEEYASNTVHAHQLTKKTWFSVSTFKWTVDMYIKLCVCESVPHSANWRWARSGDSNWQLLKPKWVGMQRCGG